MRSTGLVAGHVDFRRSAAVPVAYGSLPRHQRAMQGCLSRVRPAGARRMGRKPATGEQISVRRHAAVGEAPDGARNIESIDSGVRAGSAAGGARPLLARPLARAVCTLMVVGIAFATLVAILDGTSALELLRR